METERADRIRGPATDAVTHDLRYVGYVQATFCDDDEGGVRKDYLDMASPPGADGSPLRSDDELQQITVGTAQPHNAPIDLAEYDPDWPRLFTREADRLRAVLGDVALRMEHVGSTSVPGLLAKPIVDVLLVVPNSADEVSMCPVGCQKSGLGR